MLIILQSALLILSIYVSSVYFHYSKSEEVEPLNVLEKPSPALGQTIANSIHQGLTDPYLKPLEKLVDFINSNPDLGDISVSLMAKWAIDDEFPVSFVYTLGNDSWEIDHPATAWILDSVRETILLEAQRKTDSNKVKLTTILVEDEEWWLGFLNYPQNSNYPEQGAGVFFKINEYLKKHVPRLIDEVVKRKRFPIISFQQSPPLDKSKSDGHISLRITMADGGTYFQRGHSFEPYQMIYAESDWYDQPVVCLKKGWDLQIFSNNSKEPQEDNSKIEILLFILSCLIITILFWWGSKTSQKNDSKY